jgi:hypothetical protein
MKIYIVREGAEWVDHFYSSLFKVSQKCAELKIAAQGESAQ